MNLIRVCSFLLATLVAVAQAPLARAVDITITMDDLPFQAVHGLVHPTGVQFGFTVGGIPSFDANYASGGPGAGVFIADPSIEGSTAGVLSIVFPAPTPIFEFGLARSDFAEIPAGAAVELFDASNASLGVTNLPLSPLVGFSEGQFTYSGTPIKRATVDFTTDGFSPRFAFDNLTFRLIPEPATLLLGLVGCASALSARRRRSVATR